MMLQSYVLAYPGLVWLEARLFLIWAIAIYAFFADPACQVRSGCKLCPCWKRSWLSLLALRSLSAACLAGWIANWDPWLMVLLSAAIFGLPLARTRVVPRYAAELECGGNAFVLLATTALITRHTAFSLVANEVKLTQELAAILLIASIVLFIVEGGTHVVRGFLNKGCTLPALQPSVAGAGNLDASEYNRGRIIGNIERLMLLAFVATQAYQALAFLMAAKGLFRGKELVADKDFGEYFLVGTLSSSLVAVAAGLAVQLTLKLLW